MAFRLADHTADIAIEAEAATLGDALSEAAQALVCVVTGRDSPKVVGPLYEEASFSLEAPDRPSLVVAFLAELLWLLASKDVLWAGGGVAVEDQPDGGLKLTARGNTVRYDASRHGRGVEVKAVTYHDLRCERGKDGRWRLHVLLDV
ncbi:MAG TPA: archease [Candidatus Thermoplasmatota archaeon]|nr:archease [Candidatus Thermoplasmatota archaeon]